MTESLILYGGLAGCVLASRSKQYDPPTTVTLVEGGPDEHANPLMIEPMGTFQLHMSAFEYNYRTVPSVNYTMSTRGGADDYNLWAKLVGDSKWSYEGLLPYFCKSETHHDIKSVDSEKHGFDGTGLPFDQDPNAGNPIGVAPYTENWRDGKQQPAGKAYGLDGVNGITNASVNRMILD
ncbi:MAG: hypothetical protein Q9179_007685 [Wetmoreana sp. 5 TL-2023]